jgi:hypothetical protein
MMRVRHHRAAREGGQFTQDVPWRSANLEEKLKVLEDHLAAQDEEALAQFQERLDMSWIFHDTALEGTVLSFHELKSAIDRDVVSDVSLIPTYDEIRAHKAAIDLVREFAANKKKHPLTVGAPQAAPVDALARRRRGPRRHVAQGDPRAPALLPRHRRRPTRSPAR